MDAIPPEWDAPRLLRERNLALNAFQLMSGLVKVKAAQQHVEALLDAGAPSLHLPCSRSHPPRLRCSIVPVEVMSAGETALSRRPSSVGGQAAVFRVSLRRSTPAQRRCRRYRCGIRYPSEETFGPWSPFRLRWENPC